VKSVARYASARACRSPGRAFRPELIGSQRACARHCEIPCARSCASSKTISRQLAFREDKIGECRTYHATLISPNNSKLRLIYIPGGAYVLNLQDVQWRVVADLLTRSGGDATIPIYWRPSMTGAKVIKALSGVSPKYEG
jgi:acetyl esterase/lipase